MWNSSAGITSEITITNTADHEVEVYAFPMYKPIVVGNNPTNCSWFDVNLGNFSAGETRTISFNNAQLQVPDNQMGFVSVFTTSGTVKAKENVLIGSARVNMGNYITEYNAYGFKAISDQLGSHVIYDGSQFEKWPSSLFTPGYESGAYLSVLISPYPLANTAIHVYKYNETESMEISEHSNNFNCMAIYNGFVLSNELGWTRIDAGSQTNPNQPILGIYVEEFGAGEMFAACVGGNCPATGDVGY